MRVWRSKKITLKTNVNCRVHIEIYPVESRGQIPQYSPPKKKKKSKHIKQSHHLRRNSIVHQKWYNVFVGLSINHHHAGGVGLTRLSVQVP